MYAARMVRAGGFIRVLGLLLSFSSSLGAGARAQAAGVPALPTGRWQGVLTHTTRAAGGRLQPSDPRPSKLLCQERIAVATQRILFCTFWESVAFPGEWPERRGYLRQFYWVAHDGGVAQIYGGSSESGPVGEPWLTGIWREEDLTWEFKGHLRPGSIAEKRETWRLVSGPNGAEGAGHVWEVTTTRWMIDGVNAPVIAETCVGALTADAGKL